MNYNSLMENQRPSFTFDLLGQYGRLGNQLWQIAWQIGSAAANDGTAHVIRNWPYRKYFSIPEELYQRPSQPTVNGNSYYQELHYWEHASDTVHRYFQPSELSIDYLLGNYPSWMIDPLENKTAIHIRAGDFLKYPDKHPIPSANYYLECAEQVPVSTRFLVFSDDQDFAKDKLKYLEGDVTFVEPLTSHEDFDKRFGEPGDQWDLFLMSLCQQHIIGNSTFSWWGAFTSQHDNVFYPDPWYGEGFDPEEAWLKAMPSSWVKVRYDV